MKWLYRFGGNSEPHPGKDQLGGKGANLFEMAALGIPVPPGFTLTTELCRRRMAGERYPLDLAAEVDGALGQLEALAGAKFGDAENPLLVSVRSGAPVSMPGMMDTILNLGLNDETVEGLARRSEDPRFAWDCYRRFLAMYGEVVLGVDGAIFERLLEAQGAEKDSDLPVPALRSLVRDYKREIEKACGKPAPSDVREQLWGAISAVFESWSNPRAQTYRRLSGIPESMGTAVTVQAMVFGNLGEDCATGVAFSRDPSTGEARLYGEFLTNAQGEDVVAGVRTPETIAKLAALFPAAHRELAETCQKLEARFRDMQDVEFTIQRGKLWMLQTRKGKRTARAMVKVAVDLVAEGAIDSKEAVRRLEATRLDELLHPSVDPERRPVPIGRGLAASAGAATGKVVFSAEDAEAAAARGEAVILVRQETSPEDIHGMHAAAGILTARGGMTSHAAVVARGMGKCCVTGCTGLRIGAKMTLGGHVVSEGEEITIDGSTGEVFLGRAPLVEAMPTPELAKLLAWADAARRLQVFANADTPRDARAARSFGAEGIGLCRTEHMFFAPDRIRAVREMILATDTGGRRRALEKILPMQREDFLGIFRAMDGLPVVIRLLDPPLHEFLPHEEREIAEVAGDLGQPQEALRARIAELTEANPMLGHRGCRLAVTFPEIYETQVRAIAEAAIAAQREGVNAIPEIMIPFVILPAELQRLREQALQVFGKPVEVGTMIELPRACLMAGQIAEHADFFSFGTNDLTQTTLGLSRDDIASFLPAYLKSGLLQRDPFVALDVEGVGQLIAMAVERGRGVKPKLTVGICGEHGGEPSSIRFFHRAGLDYVSCSPYRVLIARVAAAQAALEE